MSGRQIKFEAYVRDFMLDQVEHDLGMLGVNRYSITPTKYRAPTKNHSENVRPFHHLREKLEVVVDETRSDAVADMLRRAVKSDPIGTVDELVRFHEVHPGVFVREALWEEDLRH